MPKKIYDWPRIFAGKQATLRKNRDYTCSQSSMVQAVRNRATKEGVKVRVVDKGNAVIVEVQDAEDQ